MKFTKTKAALVLGAVLALLWQIPAVQSATKTTARQIYYTATGTGAQERTQHQKNGDVVSVCDFIGATCPSGGDDTAAINKAIASVTAGVVDFPAGTYQVGPLTAKSHVWLRFHNSTLKLNASQGVNAKMFDLSGMTDVGFLGDFSSDGNRANQTNLGDQGQFAIYIGPGASDIYIQSGYAKNWGGDSLYIGHSGTAPKGIAIGRWVTDNAYRNGVSITNAQDVDIGYLEARNTNGAAPQAGLDIETNVAGDTLTNIRIGHFDGHGNTGFGIQFVGQISGTTLPHGGVTIGRLDAYSNTGGGVLVQKVSHITVQSGAIYSNSLDGVTITRDVQHLRLQAHIYNNQQRGIDGALTTQDFASSDWDFSGSVVRNNSQAVANTYDGIRLDSDDGTKVLTRIRGYLVKLYDDQGVMTQRYGLSGGTNVSGVDFTGYIPANATASYTTPAPSYVETAPRLYASQTFNYSTPIANGTCSTQTFTITGTATNDTAIVAPAGSFDGMVVMGVAGTNTVRLQLCNLSGGSVTPGTIRFQFTIVKH